VDIADADVVDTTLTLSPLPPLMSHVHDAEADVVHTILAWLTLILVWLISY